MVWKQATDCCAGTAAIYGAPDVLKISQLFSDTDVCDTVTIHESVLWEFKSDACTGDSIRISNPAQSFTYNIRATAIAAQRDIILPLLAGDDTWVFEAHCQTLTNKTIAAACNTITMASTDLSDTASIVLLASCQTLTCKTITFACCNTIKPLESLAYAASDETTALTCGVKLTWHMPYAFTLTDIKGSLTTVSCCGVVTVDVHEGACSIMACCKVQFDACENTTETACCPPVITDATLADNAVMTIIVDAAGMCAAGLKVTLIGHQT